MIAALYSEMKCQGQASRPPFPYSWWSERKCNSGAKGHSGEVKHRALSSSPNSIACAFPMGNLISNKLSHSPQYSACLPPHPCLPWLSSCPSPSSPPYLVKPYDLPRLSSTATFFMKSPCLPCQKQLWLLAPRIFHLCLCTTLGICFHTPCCIFSPFLSLKHPGVRN